MSYGRVGGTSPGRGKGFKTGDRLATGLEYIGHGANVASNFALPGAGIASAGAFAMAQAIRNGIKKLAGLSDTLDAKTQEIVDEINYTLQLMPNDLLDHRYTREVKDVALHIRQLISDLEFEIKDAYNKRYNTRFNETAFKAKVRDLGLQISLAVGHMNLLHNMR